MPSLAPDVAIDVRLANVVAIISWDTYQSVLPYALACAGDAGADLTVFTYVPGLLLRACGALAGYTYDGEMLAAEIREVELAANALLSHRCSVRFIGSGPRPLRECLRLIRATAPDVVVASERHALMLRGVRTAARGRCAVLVARRTAAT